MDLSKFNYEVEEYMTSRFPAHHEIGVKAICPTGEPYIVLSCGGTKLQDESIRVVTTDAEKAVEFFKREFDKYAEDKVGSIYWRRKPEVSVDKYLNELTMEYYKFFRVTARFIITNKPRLI